MFKPKFTITNKITNGITQIERVRGFLEAAELKKEWLSEMRSKALILETHHSTHIEGTQLTLEQATKILTGKKVEGVRPDDRKELLNYKEAMDFVSRYLKDENVITENLIKEIHKFLVKGVRGNSAEPGNYRKVQNYVVNSLTGEIIYTPPPPEDVSHLIKEFVDWLNSSDTTDISPIIIAGIAQYQFVHIHPFLDGNGRTARVLCTLILYKYGYDFKKLFSLSEYYDKNRPTYYKALRSVREHNMDMTHWLEYFVDGLKSQMVDIRKKGEIVIKGDILIQKARGSGLNPRQVKLLRTMIKKIKITRSEYLEMFKVSTATAKRDLTELVDKDFLTRIGKKGRNVYYQLKL